ncbi:unnamed protein product [Schistosoma margrebowiei]|uniref:Uncharacterized protein n=1 Tax=Schistosoma margrebowiei TaxID=48269 RepID=A0A3P8EDP8_9TREM|nr:unnamed protein product [Schistosoma margrebowiei]
MHSSNLIYFLSYLDDLNWLMLYTDFFVLNYQTMKMIMVMNISYFVLYLNYFEI